MKLILVTLALTGLLAACTKSPVDTPALSVSEASALSPRTAESVIAETEQIKQWFDERFEERLSRSSGRESFSGTLLQWLS
jgi:hypothetical protein